MAERVGKSDERSYHTAPHRRARARVTAWIAAYSPSSSVTSRLDSLLLKFSSATRQHPADATAGDRGTSHRDGGVQVMGRKLYVGNLPYEVGETELQELFGRAGSVESVTVMRDQMTGRAR